jgi:hypothetical protein
MFAIKPRSCLLVLVAVMIALAITGRAHAADAVVGVNVIDPYKLSLGEQNAMLQEMKHAGVRVVRASIILNDDGVALAQRLWEQGIKVDWMIYRFGGYAPGGRPLSYTDPEQFRASFAPILAKLEQSGIKLAAFELGNEINLAGYNPDFPPSGRGVQFGLNDLYQDPEAQQVAKGYLRYLKVLAVLKDIRDHSRLNQNTPILTAGMATYETDEGPLPNGAKSDLVSANATLDYLRANGLDRLVDAYAVHVYPSGNGPGDPRAAADRQARLARFVLARCRPAGSADGKPCWLTEWGFNNIDTACPSNDVKRSMLVGEMMNNFRPYVRQGRLVGLLYFSWNNDPGSKTVSPLTVYRCGSLTESGKLSIDASLLR